MTKVPERRDAKRTVWPGGNLVLPAPAALVSCASPGEKPNVLTVSWCGNVNTNPPMLFISVRPGRHSHPIIAASGEFVLNVPSTALARAVDYCGVASGRDVDKFEAMGLTAIPVGGVSCPAVGECPVSLSCRVSERRELGSHDMFLASVEEVSVDARLIDRTGRFLVERADLLCYAHGHYFGLGKKIGHFGWSVRKREGARKKRHS